MSTPSFRARAVCRLWPVLLLATGAAGAQEAKPITRQEGPAEQFDLSLRVGMSSSDNIQRVPVNEESGTIASAGVDLGYKHNSRRITADVDVDTTYEDYSDDAFEDGVVGGVDALFEFGFVPERFTWFAQENFGQVNSDPFEADTPANREDVNYFTTGPDLTMQFGSAMSFRIGARYSAIQYEVTNADGNETEGTMALERQLSGSTAVSLNVDGTRYEYDDPVANTEYDRLQAFLRYKLKGARTDLSVDLGYSRIDVDGETPGGTLVRISLSRQMSRSASLTLTASQEFSTAGDQFREGQDSFGAGGQSTRIVGTSDPFTSKQLGLGYEFERNRTSIGFGVQYDRERYENQSQYDRDLTTWRANLRRQLSPVLDVNIFARLEQQDFETVDFSDDELDAGAYLNWQIGRRLSARFQYDRFDRDGTNGTDDYTENRGSIFLIWSPSLH